MHGRGFGLLHRDVGARNFAQVVTVRGPVRDHHAQVVRSQLKRKGTLVNQRHAIVNFHPPGFQFEDCPDRLPAVVLFGLRDGLVSAAVGIDDEMDCRAVHLQKVETSLASNSDRIFARA